MRKAIALTLALAIAVTMIVVAAGCGESQQKEKQALATDLQNLQLSLTQLVNPNTYKSASTFNSTWTKIQSDYQKVVADAQKIKQTDVNNVKSSYNDLKKAVGNVSSDQSIQQKADAIITAGTSFITSLQQLANSVNPSK